MLVKTDRAEYVRDSRSGALLNTDTAGLQEYKNRREQIKLIGTLKNEVENLKSEVNDLRILIDQILEKVS